MYTLPNTPEILTLFDEQNTRPKPHYDIGTDAWYDLRDGMRIHHYDSIADAAAALGVTFEESK